MPEKENYRFDKFERDVASCEFREAEAKLRQRAYAEDESLRVTVYTGLELRVYTRDQGRDKVFMLCYTQSCRALLMAPFLFSELDTGLRPR